MESKHTQVIDERDRWQVLLSSHSQSHLLQSWDWGELKRRFGWAVVRLGLDDRGQLVAGAQVLFRPLGLGLNMAYVPKGPLLDWRDSSQVTALLAGLHDVCRKHRSVLLKIEPHFEDGEQIKDVICSQGFEASPFAVQPPRTILVNLDAEEDAILASMKQKTRYNIRLAARKGVSVRIGGEDDLPVFYDMMRVTGQRDGFGIHNLSYYRAAFDLFSPDRVALLLAEVDDQPVAGLMVFAHFDAAYYLFGASTNTHRERMPTYLLQWEAMRWARERGCLSYDLWGVPDLDEADMEKKFVERSTTSDGLWGVYRFKRGFGGSVIRELGTFDFAYNRPLYRVYGAWMARRRGNSA